MGSWIFFSSLLALNVVIHLIRLPHMILENGGGAFMILFYLAVYAIALPLLFAEVILTRKVAKKGLRALLIEKRASGLSILNGRVSLFFGYFHGLLLLMLFLFFIYVTSVSISYFFRFTFSPLETDIVTFKFYPHMGYSLSGIFAIVFLVYICMKSFYKTFMKLSSAFMVPFCLSVFLFIFLKILLSINGFDGLRTLFYPDFASLTKESVLFALGHALISMLVCLNFFSLAPVKESSKDAIQLLIHAATQTLLTATVIGVLALPMLQQTGETPYGASWMFETLPRWLSYSEYGGYYCSLFYFAISYLCFYLTVLICELGLKRVKSLLRKHISFLTEKFLVSGFTASSIGVIIFYQQDMKAFWGRGIVQWFDKLYVHWLLPFMCCGIVWITFWYTSQKERMELFQRQKVFFHSHYFFRAWQFNLYLVPVMIIAAWIISML